MSSRHPLNAMRWIRFDRPDRANYIAPQGPFPDHRMPIPAPALAPTPYHEELCGFLQRNETDLWKWFSSVESQHDHAESLRMDLLKQTYRLEAGTHPDLFQAAEDARLKLGLDIPVSLYQAQQSDALNASIFVVPGEAHILLSGPVLTLLEPAELRAVLGHELAHYRLWIEGDGRFHVTDRIIESIAQDPRTQPSHVQSARRLRLYTEIYADRGALGVCGDIAPVVSGLVKMQTGLKQVSAESYIRQADEIFSKANVSTEGVSHPEAFIRARALKLWADGGEASTEEVKRMIEGAPALDTLDLPGQERLTALTRRFLSMLLRPAWFHTDAVLGRAKMFFPDFEPPKKDHVDDTLWKDLGFADPKLREYLGYLMLDFVVADPDLEDAPLGAACECATRLGMDDLLEKLAHKELKIRKKDFARTRKEALAKAGLPPAKGGAS